MVQIMKREPCLASAGFQDLARFGPVVGLAGTGRRVWEFNGGSVNGDRRVVPADPAPAAPCASQENRRSVPLLTNRLWFAFVR
jgi:hypothetical protein